jgi:hypothetical protein
MAEEYAIVIKVILYREEGKPPTIRQVVVTDGEHETIIDEVKGVKTGQAFVIHEEPVQAGHWWELELNTWLHH